MRTHTLGDIEHGGLHRLAGGKIAEIERVIGPHFAGEFEAAGIAIDGDDVVDAGGADDGHQHQADGAAALDDHTAAEIDEAGHFRPLQGVGSYGCRLDEHPEVEAHVIDDEKRGPGAHDEPLAEVSIEVVFRLIRQQAVDAEVVAEIGLGRIVFGDHAGLGSVQRAGDQFVPHPYRLADAVHFHGAAHLDDLAGALVTEDHGNQVEGVVFVAMDIGAADSAGLHADEDFIVVNGAQRELAQFEFFPFHEHRRTATGGNCGRGR